MSAPLISDSGKGNNRAALWQPGIGGAQDLDNLIQNNTEGWILAEADAINDNGQIVGWGYVPSGDIHAFRLDPVRR